MEHVCVVSVLRWRCQQAVHVGTGSILLRGVGVAVAGVVAEEEGQGHSHLAAWVADSAQGLQGGRGHAPPGLFLDHQGMMIIVVEVILLISRNAADLDHRLRSREET